MSILILAAETREKKSLHWPNKLKIEHIFTPPICESCGVEFTVKHILIDCFEFSDSSFKHHIPQKLSEALQPDLQ